MKTSNKLLLVFILLIFITPFCISLAFKSKIKGHNYQSETINFNPSTGLDIQSGKLKNIKVIKIEGIKSFPRMLVCHIIPSDTPRYSYEKFKGINNIVTDVNSDTLFIKYNRTADSLDLRDRYYNELNIKLFLKDMRNIIANYATVIYSDNVHRINSSVNLSLDNYSNLIIGANPNKLDVWKNQDNLKNTLNSFNDINLVPIEFNDLSISAKSSSVYLGSANVKHLNLNVDSASLLLLSKHFNPESVKETISPNSLILANYSFIKKGIK